ncbi:MAG: ABC transporter substrate-binding protein [Treponema sp.]|jgi:oligopeptide transport system substrate-binding protein|nr:ABC transporter substrate-binding protein [Treponema sp.]
MMNLNLRRVLLTALAAVLVFGVLAGCTRTSATSARTETGIKELVYPLLQTRELETFNILYSQRAEDSENLTNLIDGLLETDPWGNLLPAIAREWGSSDGGLTWTFRLRQGVKWVDVNGNAKADNNAHDWGTALEWILNFHKNDSANTSMPIELIRGAEDYYEWTKTLSAADGKALKAERGSRFFQMVGIEIPDDYTIVYHCLAEMPYFDTVSLYQCLYPMSQAMVDALGGPDNVRSMDNRNMWYNGGYTMTTYIPRNEKIFTKNPLYWDPASERFDTVTIKMVDSTDVSYQLYQSGEVDYTLLSESNLNTIYNNPNHQYHNYLIPDPMSKYSYQMHFNYDKKNADGTPDTNWNTAIANTAFRRTWWYGLDMTDYWKRTNSINPMLMENNFYTMKGLVNTTDGVEFTELVRRELGLAPLNGRIPARLDADKLAQYKAQAIRELTALGVTFPVRVDHYVAASNQTALDTAVILRRIFSECLGDDFVQLQINTYVSSIRQEVVNPSLQSISINGWGADYGDPQNYHAQYVYGDDNAYYSATYTNINRVTQETAANRDLLTHYREYTRLARAADAIRNDRDARYRAFARAEAYMLDNVLVLPALYQQIMALGKIDNTSRMIAMYGINDMKFKNWRTNVNGVTTEEAATAATVHSMGGTVRR